MRVFFLDRGYDALLRSEDFTKIGGFQAKEMWNFTHVVLMLVVLVVLVGIDPDYQLVCRNPSRGL
jgi:hypothetical protein